MLLLILATFLCIGKIFASIEDLGFFYALASERGWASARKVRFACGGEGEGGGAQARSVGIIVVTGERVS